MLTLVLFVIFLLVAAALWFHGLWSNVITFINIILAAMVAINYFEPVARLAEKQSPDYAHLWDFLALWGLFAITFGLSRLVTDLLSRKRVAFPYWVEMVGRSLVAICIAYIFVGFTCVTLHTAPLGPHPMGFQMTPTSGNFLGLAPDQQWLGVMQSRSRGALRRGESDPAKMSPLAEDANTKARIFDPESKFILKYYQRRAELAQE